jgi:hypothetical protein
MFVTDYTNNPFQGASLDETLYRETKFSLYNGDINQLPPRLGCLFLRVGLLLGTQDCHFLSSFDENDPMFTS